MKPKSHRKLTKLAFELLSESLDYFPLRGSKNVVAEQSYDTDYERDLEFVDVDFGRDDPHKDEGWLVDDDEAHYAEGSLYVIFRRNYYFTALNHFIDIRKGAGEFDDFDGYGYHRGSASRGEYEKVLGRRIDHMINWWLRDKYVHVPGSKWYRGCSPSVERYSFPQDKGVYSSRTDEGKKRFPLAESKGKKNKGIPYSVFMPVDNMARYWYGEYKRGRNPSVLGYVMHAIQDASVPHHAAGCCGNWHARYEEVLVDKINGWANDTSFRNDVKSLFDQWNKVDGSLPRGLNVGDWNKVPHRNWRIEWLVTWLALNAYRAYDAVHQDFSGGWRLDEGSMKDLTKKGAATCMLALYE